MFCNGIVFSISVNKKVKPEYLQFLCDYSIFKIILLMLARPCVSFDKATEGQTKTQGFQFYT